MQIGGFSVRSGRNLSICEEILDFRRETQRSDIPEQYQAEHIDAPLQVEKKIRPASAYIGKSFGLPPKS